MSLKMFHLVFIVSASALAFGCGVWWLKDYWSAHGQPADLAYGLGALLVGIALLVYERYFLKKSKGIGFL